MEELRIYSLAEIENLLQCSRRSLYRWIKTGELKAIRLGREYRVRYEDLQAFLDARSTSPGNPRP